MAVNRDKPDKWNNDIKRSVDKYNAWFMQFAPEAYRTTRLETTKHVADTLTATDNFADISGPMLKANPRSLATLRMSTCPPLAIDRLIGLSGVPANLIKTMEKNGGLPARMSDRQVNTSLRKISSVIQRLADPIIFVWLERGRTPSNRDIHRAATIIADRLCGAAANPIIRNAQELRQLGIIARWLVGRGYAELSSEERPSFDEMQPGTFSFRMNVSGSQASGNRQINIPVDAVVMPKATKSIRSPLFIEAKSAGDFANVNKRRKEEAVKVDQLRRSRGQNVRYILFLCGYFDAGYLGYEAAEGIDWVWEHRTGDLAKFGL